MRWKVRFHGSYFTLENQNLPGHYLKAHRRDEPVRVADNSYPQGDNKYLWIADGSTTSFTLKNKAYEPRYMYVQSDHDMEFSTNTGNPIYYKFWTPVISEFTDVVAVLDNPDDAIQTYSISFTIGIA